MQKFPPFDSYLCQPSNIYQSLTYKIQEFLHRLLVYKSLRLEGLLFGGPIEASSIDRTHQSRSPEDEGRAIPRNAVVYKQGDDGESPKFKKQ
jgi:hypothetical protein